MDRMHRPRKTRRGIRPKEAWLDGFGRGRLVRGRHWPREARTEAAPAEGCLWPSLSIGGDWPHCRPSVRRALGRPVALSFLFFIFFGGNSTRLRHDGEGRGRARRGRRRRSRLGMQRRSSSGVDLFLPSLFFFFGDCWARLRPSARQARAGGRSPWPPLCSSSAAAGFGAGRACDGRAGGLPTIDLASACDWKSEP
ncbi:hypothetical protein COCNU_contig69233470G000010 [Cocos nucifera]|nr:hypothetical protein [Cocos nucifera]